MKDLKTIVYDYHFNYFGKDTYNGNAITGGNISVALHFFRNGEEIKIEKGKEPKAQGYYLSDIFHISLDNLNGFTITKDIFLNNLFKNEYDFDKIDFEIVGYHLTDKEFQPTIQVSEKEFKAFLLKQIDDFNLSKCVTVEFI